ncbi:benenodin family lasso peptide [Flavisphingomonas formosensis]|nr:benenodin family lasso peptide [Sphingomonas formosensis]
MNETIDTQTRDIIDLGVASVVTQGSGSGAIDFNLTPKDRVGGGIADD